MNHNNTPEQDVTAQQSFSTPTLGEMQFCRDDLCWVGQYNGFEFRIAAAPEQLPDDALLAYCREVLADAEGLMALLETQKQQKLGCHGGCFDDEILHLTYLNLMFYRRADSLRILAQLSPRKVRRGGAGQLFEHDDKQQRLWRLEFYDGRCQGLDFEY